jgi:AcrR family transcriptional regulator
MGDVAADKPTGEDGPRVGRPRVHDDEHILNVALELLPEVGYQALSIARIADASGVSKPAVYRRWNNKAELVASAIVHAQRDQQEPTGVLRDDLIAQLRAVRMEYERMGHMGMVGVLLSEETRHPEFLRAWREVAVTPRRDRIHRIVRLGVERGEVRPRVNPTVTAQSLIGSFYAAYIAGESLDEAWDEQVIDQLLTGIAT